VSNYICGCVPLDELMHSEPPDGAVGEVKTSHCRLDSYLVQEVIDP